MAELALIRAIPDLIVGGLERGRLKSIMARLQKSVDLDLAKMRRPSKKDTDWIWEIVDTFRRQSGWGKRHHHPGTLVCFCLAIIDRSGRKFNPKILNLLNDISEYYDRAGDLHRPSMWAADLACKRWLALFGIREDDGPGSDERLRRIDAEIARAVSLDEYRMKQYSQVIITDDNFDDEHEKLCEIIGVPHTNSFDVYDELPEGFTKQAATGRDDEPLGFAEHVKSKVVPNKGSDFSQAFQVGEVAYQFANLFISKHYEVVL